MRREVLSRRGLLGVAGITAVAAALTDSQLDHTPVEAAPAGPPPDFQTGQITVFDKDQHKVDIAQGGTYVTVVNNQGTLGTGKFEFSTGGVGQVAGIVSDICGGGDPATGSKQGEFSVMMKVTEPNCIDAIQNSQRLQKA